VRPIYIYMDLEMRLLLNEKEAISDYKKAKPWLKKLLQAYADGINFYLYKHPEVKPLLLNHFEPWFPLLWTDGSIGAISTGGLSTAELKSFYADKSKLISYIEREKDYYTGSNGFAFGPSKTESGNAILYINPHTSFYFRPEVQMVSEEGLNAYGAVTWGQFFIYQGFNENCGWMHTSSSVDVADLYAEKIIKKNNKFYYEYEKKLLPLSVREIEIKYNENNKLLKKRFTTYATHHGPIMGERDGKWISLKSNNRNVNSLIQSWIRTKSKNFEEYQSAMNLKANTSNNTVYADKNGNIAYWHGNFIPKRDKKINWSNVVDGTTETNEWKGLHEVNESVHLYNPINGWLQNCNSTPYTVAGNNSPKRENYAAYMAPDGENFRGLNAVRVLSKEEKFTLEKVINAGYDTKLSIFEILIPALITSFENRDKSTDDGYQDLIEPINILKNWDYYATENSIATTLAIEWALKLDPIIQKSYINEGEKDQVENTKAFAANASRDQLLPQLLAVINELKLKHGSWQIPWGAINRFQRLVGDIDSKFDDNQESIAVGNASATWGCLPAYKSNYQNNSKKRYGYNGNSFVCAVEFGAKVVAKSILYQTKL
jgi:acyl-homoserine-lactone acylase